MAKLEKRNIKIKHNIHTLAIFLIIILRKRLVSCPFHNSMSGALRQADKLLAIFFFVLFPLLVSFTV